MVGSIDMLSTQNLIQARQDIMLSWRLFRDNWRAFLSTEIFAILAFLVTILGLEIVLTLLRNVLSVHTLLFMSIDTEFISNFIAVIVLNIFLTCQYGLAYDIISSGDMFAEFKGAFVYFKHYWWRYALLALFTQWLPATFEPFILILRLIRRSSLGLPQSVLYPVILVLFIRLVIYFVWFIIFIIALVSVTAQGSILQSFKEDLFIIRNIHRRVFLSLGLTFLLFIIPQFLVHVATISVYNSVITTNLRFIPALILALAYSVDLFIGTPMIALVATRIYNSVDFRRKESV